MIITLMTGVAETAFATGMLVDQTFWTTNNRAALSTTPDEGDIVMFLSVDFRQAQPQCHPIPTARLMNV